MEPVNHYPFVSVWTQLKYAFLSIATKISILKPNQNSFVLFYKMYWADNSFKRLLP